MTNNWVRTLCAMMLAPVTVFAVLLALGFIVDAVTSDSIFSPSVLIVVISIVSIFNAVATWTIGLAWHSILLWVVRRPQLDLYLLPGTLFGWLLMRVTYFQPHGGFDNPILGSAIGALFGATTASVFWLIRRPDRDAPNPTTPPP